MALYKVTDSAGPEDAPCRLVKANSAAAALRHVAGTRFNVEVVMNAERTADILMSGVMLEVAGEEAAPTPDVVEEIAEVEEVEDAPVEEEIVAPKPRVKAAAE